MVRVFNDDRKVTVNHLIFPGFRFGIEYIRPLLYGGVAYTIGAVMEYARFPVVVPRLIGPHELFHIMVLIGIIMHWIFIHRVAGSPTTRAPSLVGALATDTPRP